MTPLYVVTMASNPVRYASRYRLYREFAEYVRRAGVSLLTVEVAFGGRPHEVTEAGNPWHVQLRTPDELWVKESAINVGIAHLSRQVPGWEYVAWVDADVSFARPDWAAETVHQLQHHPVVQMFGRAVDLCPAHEPVATHRGFVASYARGEWEAENAPYLKYHPGFAWAARRAAIDTLGGLFDVGILGSGDRHMAMALLGDAGRSHPPGISPGYAARLGQYQARAATLRKNVGYVPGTLLHYWHGKKADRRYGDRWRVLIDRRYDPDTDVCRDAQGLLRWVDDMTPRHVALRDQVRAYFRARNEDSIDP